MRLANGFAMFSMFFGAGNVIFPLIVGQAVGGGISYALLGLLLTAVVMPFAGLLAITLFEGDYMAFFQRMGKWPGLMMSALIIAIVGPFGGIPRCVTLTYASVKFYLPELPLIPFAIGSCLLLFVCCIKKHRIIDLLGMVLTPFLLFFLGVIVVKGIFFSSPETAATLPVVDKAFFYGLKGGYNTMDLLAALFFSSIICTRLKEEGGDFFSHFGRAAAIGAVLLGLVYIGFGKVASLYAPLLHQVPADQLLSSIGSLILGPFAGIVVCMAVMLSCLTTAIALVVVSAEFIQKITSLRYSHALALVITVTGFVTMLEFSGIVRMLAPLLEVCYPALIMLSLLNILHKTLNVQIVKLPVYAIIIFMVLFSLA